jgi:hypothetical protein
MADHSFGEVTFDAEIFGTVYTVKKPSALEQISFESKVSKNDDFEKLVGLCVDYLDTRGIPKKESNKLDLDQLRELVNLVNTYKKKSSPIPTEKQK